MLFRSPSWDSISLSVARITWVEGAGQFLCSGTLLATQNGDLTPYYLTSAHCIDTQAQANGVEFRWFYQHDVCDGPTFMTLAASNSAELLATSGASTGADWTLLMVKGVLPAGVTWSGWTSATPTSGTNSVGIHHPAGSWKRWSRGLQFISSFFWYHRIAWNTNEGAIVGGSSGSGIWTESSQLLYGNLSFTLGESSCASIEDAHYGRFDRYYSSISSFLAGGSDDILDDNDTCAGAMIPGNNFYQDLVVKSVDEDWYRLTLGTGDELLASLSFTDANGNIDVELYDACGGTLVASETSVTNDELLTYTNSGPQADFYLRVYLADDTRNTYSMNIVGTAEDCNANGQDDACDVDCGLPGCAGLPNCGQSLDCNNNNEPDECELGGNDCNGNTIPDDCDMADLIVTDPADHTGCPGDTAVFSISAPGAGSYQWYKDAVPLVNGGKISGATTNTLTVTNTDRSEERRVGKECRSRGSPYH